MLRRAVEILLVFTRRTGHNHPNQETVIDNYAGLLRALGRSEQEINATLTGLRNDQADDAVD